MTERIVNPLSADPRHGNGDEPALSRDEPRPVLRCPRCDLALDNPEALSCPRCCRLLVGAGGCKHCSGCRECGTD
ncbi:MAG: hypothetical protein ACYDDH_09215 [Candidatus Desulforudaceae bacterium]|nr:hypothetical protein [Eubacteriales bacterium]